jgi:hypothetical protein
VLEQMRAWGVSRVGAECSFPALGCYGVPDTLPHIRGLLVDAGFAEPARTEFVLVARCEMARSSAAARWADVGNLIVPDESELRWAMPQLLSCAAEWLLLGGITRLVDYWAKDVDPSGYLDQLHELGFQTLVVNERGFLHAL